MFFTPPENVKINSIIMQQTAPIWIEMIQYRIKAISL